MTAKIDHDNNTPDNGPEYIDECASRLVDGDLSLSEIEPRHHAAIRVRAASFAENRRLLSLAVEPLENSNVDRAIQSAVATVLPFRRRRLVATLGSMAAAIIGVAVIGVAVIGIDTSNPAEDPAEGLAETMASRETIVGADSSTAVGEVGAETAQSKVADAPAASATPFVAEGTTSAAVAVIETVDDLALFTSAWYPTNVELPTKTFPVCADPLRPAVDLIVTFAEDPVEIHFSRKDGVVVYRLDDCSLLAGIVP